MTAPLSAAPPQRRGASMPRRPVLPLLLGFACLLRLVACFNDFWLDEVWSWAISVQLTSPWQVLTRSEARSDNNHPLNTLWMYAIGDTPNWFAYRLPALVAGILTVGLSVFLARRRSLVEPLLTAILLGLSFPLVTYSSEARGYAPMILCAVAAYAVLSRFLDDLRPRQAWAFAGLSAVGVLWHLTYVHFLLAAGVWAAVSLARRQSPGRVAGNLLQLFGVPAVVLVAYAWGFLRHLQVGGSPDASTWDAVFASLSLTLGGPMAGAGVYLGAAVVFALLMLALAWLYRSAREEFWFYATVLFVAPAIILVAQASVLRQPEGVQVRYLLVCLTFALMLLARYGAAMFRAGGWRRNVCLGVLALALLGNGFHLGRFMGDGRGGYRAAVERMASATPGETITLSTDDPFRTGMLLSYYKRFLPPGKRLQYVPDTAEAPARWRVLNVNEELDGTPPPIVHGGVTYMFDSVYPAYGLSGWTWVLFRSDAPASVTR